MYVKAEDNQRMTDVEASERYPDSYIIMRMDNMNTQMGTILYIGDDQDEIISLVMKQTEPYCGVIEGLNYQRSLGGVACTEI